MRLNITILLLLTSSFCFGQDLNKIQSLYQKGNNEEVVIEGREILNEHPENLTVNHLMGRALTDLKKFEDAIIYLEKVIYNKTSPNWMLSWSHAYLGICYYALDKQDEAKKNLEFAIKNNATENSTNFANKRIQGFQLTSYFEDWEIIETDHIRFHFQNNNKIDNLKEYCNQREQAYIKINDFFKASPYKKIDFYVWSNAKEGKKILGKEIGFANSDFCIINSKSEQTKGHEITHILSNYGIFPENKNRLINEGVAVAFDQTKQHRIELAKAANNKNIGIQELMHNSEKIEEKLIYTVGGAFIEYLLSKKDEETLKLLIKNQTWENLIALYGKETIKEFEEKIKR